MSNKSDTERADESIKALGHVGISAAQMHDVLSVIGGRSFSNYNDVLDLHVKFDLPQPAFPRMLTDEEFDFRDGFMEEELQEFRKGFEENDIDEMADALIDIVYVAIGTAIFMGLPWQSLWNEVHRANMSKERGTNAKRGSFQADLVKPDGWTPPQIDSTLEMWRDAVAELIEGREK